MRISCLYIYFTLLGGWDLVGISNDSEWSINSDEFLNEKIRGSSAFFALDVGVDDKNPSHYVLTVCANGMYLCIYTIHMYEKCCMV